MALVRQLVGQTARRKFAFEFVLSLKEQNGNPLTHKVMQPTLMVIRTNSEQEGRNS